MLLKNKEVCFMPAQPLLTEEAGSKLFLPDQVEMGLHLCNGKQELKPFYSLVYDYMLGFKCPVLL